MAKPPRNQLNQRFLKYNQWWTPHSQPVGIELKLISMGGQFKKQNGTIVGNGLFFHFKECIKLIWPEVVQHRWFDYFLEYWLKHKYVGVLGPKNCVAGETRILNPITGEQPTIRELCEGGISPVVMTMNGPALAAVPFVKGFDDLYEVTLSNGQSFSSTGGHKVLTPSGYVQVSALSVGSLLSGYERVLLPSTSGTYLSTHGEDVQRSLRIAAGSSGDCPTLFYSCDERPPLDRGIFQVFSPSSIGALEHGRLWREDGRDNRSSHNRQRPQFVHLSNSLPYGLSDVVENVSTTPLSAGRRERDDGWSLPRWQWRTTTPRPLSFLSGDDDSSQPLNFCGTCHEYKDQQTTVASVKFVRRDYYYDLQVPNHHHYFAEGAIHHNSGKSHNASIFHLIDYYAFPLCTTIIVCSTTKEALEDRIWAEIKKFHRLAADRVPWLPGHLIEGRMRLITDDRDEAEDGRDFRNGFVGIPVMKGNAAAGLSAFVGRKNKRVKLLGDEIQFLPPAFLDSTANLDGSGGGSDFKLTGMGNPSDITNSLGLLCEPAAHLGGWESGIDQTPGTKAWETRYNNGIAIQLPGSDSPNMDVPDGQPVPFPFLITRQQLKDDGARWGTDDWHYLMFDEGRFPRGQGSRRVITRQLCLRGRAMDEPIWANTQRTKIASLDSAFRAVGGDRCVFTRAEFGMETAAPMVNAETGELTLISQDVQPLKGRTIFALIEQKIIPIKASETKGAALSIEEAEDQIVKFVMDECGRNGIPPENFFFDAGMKASLVAAFARLWSPRVTPVDFDGKPTERRVSREIDISCREYYFNFVTEMWYSTRMVIDAGQFRGMTEAVMMEGCKREFEKVMGNKIQVEPKKEMKQKTGESPDLFDSLVIAIEGARQKGFTIAKFDNVKADTSDDKWKARAREQASKLWKSGALNYAA